MVLVLAAYGTPDQSAAGAEPTGFNSSSIGGSLMVRGLGSAIYHVADLHRATTWYTQAFQQEPYFDEPFYVGFNIGGYELGLDPDFTLSKPGPGGGVAYWRVEQIEAADIDRKSTRLNSSHGYISYAVFCLKKKKTALYTAFTPNV